jgi:hypothetical protein
LRRHEQVRERGGRGEKTHLSQPFSWALSCVLLPECGSLNSWHISESTQFRTSLRMEGEGGEREERDEGGEKRRVVFL